MSSVDLKSRQPLEHWVVMAAIAVSITLASLVGAIRFALAPLAQPRFPVVGSLVYDGLPAAGARIAFLRCGNDKSGQPIATAIVHADGSFRAITLGLADGLPAGRYAVTLQWQPPTIRGDEYLPGDNV